MAQIATKFGLISSATMNMERIDAAAAAREFLAALASKAEWQETFQQIFSVASRRQFLQESQVSKLCRAKGSPFVTVGNVKTQALLWVPLGKSKPVTMMSWHRLHGQEGIGTNSVTRLATSLVQNGLLTAELAEKFGIKEKFWRHYYTLTQTVNIAANPSPNGNGHAAAHIAGTILPHGLAIALPAPDDPASSLAEAEALIKFVLKRGRPDPAALGALYVRLKYKEIEEPVVLETDISNTRFLRFVQKRLPKTLLAITAGNSTGQVERILKAEIERRETRQIPAPANSAMNGTAPAVQTISDPYAKPLAKFNRQNAEIHAQIVEFRKKIDAIYQQRRLNRKIDDQLVAQLIQLGHAINRRASEIAEQAKFWPEGSPLRLAAAYLQETVLELASRHQVKVDAKSGGVFNPVGWSLSKDSLINSCSIIAACYSLSSTSTPFLENSLKFIFMCQAGFFGPMSAKWNNDGSSGNWQSQKEKIGRHYWKYAEWPEHINPELITCIGLALKEDMQPSGKPTLMEAMGLPLPETYTMQTVIDAFKQHPLFKRFANLSEATILDPAILDKVELQAKIWQGRWRARKIFSTNQQQEDHNRLRISGRAVQFAQRLDKLKPADLRIPTGALPFEGTKYFLDEWHRAPIKLYLLANIIYRSITPGKGSLEEFQNTVKMCNDTIDETTKPAQKHLNLLDMAGLHTLLCQIIQGDAAPLLSGAMCQPFPCSISLYDLRRDLDHPKAKEIFISDDSAEDFETEGDRKHNAIDSTIKSSLARERMLWKSVTKQPYCPELVFESAQAINYSLKDMGAYARLCWHLCQDKAFGLERGVYRKRVMVQQAQQVLDLLNGFSLSQQASFKKQPYLLPERVQSR
ncbi:MAG: hypothetical protein AB7G80_09480 [Dongiaceae bacterium]